MQIQRNTNVHYNFSEPEVTSSLSFFLFSKDFSRDGSPKNLKWIFFLLPVVLIIHLDCFVVSYRV